MVAINCSHSTEAETRALSSTFHHIEANSICDRYYNKTLTHPRLQCHVMSCHARLFVLGPGASAVKTKTIQFNSSQIKSNQVNALSFVIV
jgi:hypothetical protein